MGLIKKGGTRYVSLRPRASELTSAEPIGHEEDRNTDSKKIISKGEAMLYSATIPDTRDRKFYRFIQADTKGGVVGGQKRGRRTWHSKLQRNYRYLTQRVD